MDARVHNVFAGHLRAIVGNMTVEDMIRDREKLTRLTRESSGTEMEKLGLIVDSLQIQAAGLSEVLAQAMSQGVAGLQMARQLLAAPSVNRKEANGKVEKDAP